MAKTIPLEQPAMDVQAMLDEVMHAEPETVEVLGKKYHVGWMRNGTERAFSHMMFKEKDAAKRGVKTAALLLLNDTFYWWRKALYPFYWRWLYYVKDISMAEVVAIQAAAQKKTPQAAYFLSTILATGMLDTIMTRRSEEVPSSPVARVGEVPFH